MPTCMGTAAIYETGRAPLHIRYAPGYTTMRDTAQRWYEKLIEPDADDRNSIRPYHSVLCVQHWQT